MAAACSLMGVAAPGCAAPSYVEPVATFDGATILGTVGDTLYLTGGVRHRWRATVADTRVVVVAVAEHIEAVQDRPRQ